MESAALPLIVRKPIWPFAIAIAVVALGGAFLLMPANIHEEPRRFWAAFALCVFAAGGIAGLFQRKPDLVISMDGIESSAWGNAFVRWEEIDRAFIVRRDDSDYLCLTLRHAGEFYKRGGPLVKLVMSGAHADGTGDLMFRPASLRLNTEETLELIELLAGWHKSDAKPPVSAVRYRTD